MAKIKRRSVSVQAEKQMLTGMIVSDRFLREVQNILRMELLQVPYVRVVVQWCLDYWQKYEAAPQRHIQDLYNSYKRSATFDEETLDQVGEFLACISDEYDATNFNVDYLLDTTEDLMRSRNLKNLADDINAALLNENLLEAEGALSSHEHIALPKTLGIQPFTDMEAVRNAFEEAAKPLFKLPGALGEMINDSLVRGGFLGIQAPEKRGKSFYLIELAVLAFRARCNVAFFGMGDMSEEELTRRLGIRAYGKSDRRKYCGKFIVPVMDCTKNQTQTCDKPKCPKQDAIGESNDELPDLEDIDDWTPCTACRGTPAYRPTHWWVWEDVGTEPLTWRQAYKAMKSSTRRTHGKQFRIACYPNSTMNFHDIETQLSVWETMEGFVPDMIVVDYADIMAPEPIQHEGFRHNENERWKQGRALAQKKHALVILATQSDTGSYDTETQTLKNFSEDKRKYGHVTGMISLNQTPDEREMGIMRLAWLLAREEGQSRRQVRVLQSLRQGRPFLGSYWRPPQKAKEAAKGTKPIPK